MFEIVCKLTCRELEVLKLIAQGYANFEIAQMLNVSDSTVRNQIQSIHAKTGYGIGKNNYAATRVKLTLFYLENYAIKENKEYRRGYNDGLKAVAKYINLMYDESEEE